MCPNKHLGKAMSHSEGNKCQTLILLRPNKNKRGQEICGTVLLLVLSHSPDWTLIATIYYFTKRLVPVSGFHPTRCSESHPSHSDLHLSYRYQQLIFISWHLWKMASSQENRLNGAPGFLTSWSGWKVHTLLKTIIGLLEALVGTDHVTWPMAKK